MASKPPTRPPTGDRPNSPRSSTPRPGTPRPGTPRPSTPRGPDRTPQAAAPRTGQRSSTPAAPRGLGQRALGQPTATQPDAPRQHTPRIQPRDRSFGGPRPSRPPEPGAAPKARTPQRPQSAPEPQRPSPEPGPATLRAPTLRAPTPAPAPPAARPQGPAAPRGSVWLHGIHPVAAALANPARRPKRLLLTEDAESNLAARLPQPWPIQPERAERAKIDHLLGRDTLHQGAALLADLLPPPALAAILARPGPLLVLDQVTDPRNIGATLRSAAAFGVAAVILQDRNAPEETGVMAKAASGALETVPLLRAVNLARTLVALKAAGLWCIGLDAGAKRLRGTDLKDRRVVLVLGSEGEGMRRLVRETCDELAGLGMPGQMESLNVSAAATLALYELTRPE